MIYTHCLIRCWISLVQVDQQREEDEHHRLHAEDVGAVQLQPGGPDQREDRGAGGGETEDRKTAVRDAPTVSLHTHTHTHTHKLNRNVAIRTSDGFRRI